MKKVNKIKCNFKPQRRYHQPQEDQIGRLSGFYEVWR